MKKRTSFFLALAAVTITVFSVWNAQRPIAAREATWDDVLAEARAGGYRIITTEALAERYRREPTALLLVDTRQEWEFRSGHIHGAVNFPMAPTGWSRWRKAGELKAFLGPDTTRVLVFY
ncbi:MAG TPA: rhodanese-like domain-containing protein [Desulfobacterales bacterium]|nr:rhodanese-like domain-containing protein [Desulfobacterales bacterium]